MRLFFCLGMALLAMGCSASESDTANGPNTSSEAGSAGGVPLRVVATVGMVADVVRNVGGNDVIVDQLMGAGVDPHIYKPTRDDVQRILEADAVFYAGLLLEGRMTDTLLKVARSRPVFGVTELIEESYLLEPEDSAGHPDPHVWMDVAAWASTIDVVQTALSELLPERAADFQRRAAEFAGQLKVLDEYGRNTIATIPADRRVLITSHDAFNYFGRAYNLEVLGVQGVSTESEAGLRRINELVDLLVERRIPAVFIESSVPRKNIEALADGAAARGHQVVIGGELYSDAMGESGTYEGTYIGMLDHNITLVTRALGGSCPPGGMQGKLTTAQ
jgi:manganese/zinc/iron transport system substrate-binding protein